MRANDLPKSALFARAFHIFFSAAGFRRVHCKIQSVINTRKQLNMLDFKPITKELLIREGRSLRRSRIQICDYTPGCLYIWRHYYHMRCAEADGMFIFESGDGSGLYYNCPVGTGDFSAAVLEARDDAEKRGIPLRFSCIPSEYVDVIQSIIGRKAEIVSDRARRICSLAEHGTRLFLTARPPILRAPARHSAGARKYGSAWTHPRLSPGCPHDRSRLHRL